MDKIIELPFTQEGYRCWMCHDGISSRAWFCNHCGCIQPVRELNHFSRLGLPQNVDVDLAKLEKNYNSLRRNFAAERFVIRSHAEKTYAAKHREAMDEAYETLRCPVSRSRYWIEIHADNKNQQDNIPDFPIQPQVVAELQTVLDAAREVIELDRLARRAGQEIEHSIMRLLCSLREKDWNEANEILSALDGLETLITQVREKRMALTPRE